MTATGSGIPTTYRSANFRSRLEARWAAMFDLVGWSWIYEPLDARGYIPDFLIEGPYPFFVEVGNCITEADYIEKAVKADRAADDLGHDLIVVGVSATPRLPIASGGFAMGWMGEHSVDPEDNHSVYWWDTGVWAGSPGHIGVYHTVANYRHRPNADGHEQGLDWDSQSGIEEMWREAGNRSQWKPR